MRNRQTIINWIVGSASWAERNRRRVTRLHFYTLMALVSMLIFSSSCNRNRVYSEKKELENGIWTYKDSLTYNFEIKDTSKIYVIGLNVLHDDNFPFENCYVRIKSVLPDKKVNSDVLSLELADETGFWLGNTSGDNFEAPIALQPKAKFNQSGNYAMTFFQFTRKDSLPGIKSLELTIDKFVE